VSGAARRTVGDWVKAYQEQGVEGLKAGWKGGNKRKLSEAQRQDLYARLQPMALQPAAMTEKGSSRGKLWSVEALEQVGEQW
jgi:transposase